VLQCPIVIAPGMVYNVQQYSGMMCQFLCELKKKRRRSGLDVIAAGGRYDNMLSNFRWVFFFNINNGKVVPVHAVKTYRRRRGMQTARVILNHSTRWK
jgi:histidyl-tRNA synthetase